MLTAPHTTQAHTASHAHTHTLTVTVSSLSIRVIPVSEFLGYRAVDYLPCRTNTHTGALVSACGGIALGV